ncbi:DeoR/GlpR family DNA-binding transcription regulator [Bacillus changyiensis]|uniref:DeoR/GlpR family DNA-binding transcription regulator n=1 Tax=Bacillus changyiensis TaxID=3004103 RepID=UPI0022E19122|nr:DeoR/GlpR family DNA-binding transcription regulator [Bacillus changyiensis]MDA1476465.1 DeoR/GlpR family DNA-binding transcription regulator [Bacillus changyiensis]
MTETTIRRDLSELEERGLLMRVHGGAKKKKTVSTYTELTNSQKQTINVEKKKEIAKKCASLIKDNDIIFISSGTTNDFIFEYVNANHVNVITNSIHVFNRIKDRSNFDVVLSGGRYRQRTGTFVGYFANQLLNEIKVTKAFVGTNGISDLNMTTANEEEGNGLRVILDHAHERYVLANSTKFNVQAFFSFYNVKNITGIITDSEINYDVEDYYKRFTRIIK